MTVHQDKRPFPITLPLNAAAVIGFRLLVLLTSPASTGIGVTKDQTCVLPHEHLQVHENLHHQLATL